MTSTDLPETGADWHENQVRKRVVMFSGGISSFAAGIRTASRFGTDDLTLLIADTHLEDADLWRFARDAAGHIGSPLTRVEDGRDPWRVFFDEGFLGNSHVPLCSKRLKIEPSRRWMEEYTDPSDTAVYVGIDWSEAHRADAIIEGWKPWRVVFPLMMPPYMDKRDYLMMAVREEIDPPRLYDLGFAHNNCGGACVRGGQAAWAHLLEIFPDRFRVAELNEQRFRAQHGDFSILKDRRGGVTRPLTLRALRERIESARAGQGTLFDLADVAALPDAYDRDDWGGCGCFSDGFGGEG